jgi:hypothetical protein
MTPEQLALTGLQTMLSSPETSCFPAEIEENLVDFLGNSIGTIHSKNAIRKGASSPKIPGRHLPGYSWKNKGMTRSDPDGYRTD